MEEVGAPLQSRFHRMSLSELSGDSLRDVISEAVFDMIQSDSVLKIFS